MDKLGRRSLFLTHQKIYCLNNLNEKFEKVLIKLLPNYRNITHYQQSTKHLPAFEVSLIIEYIDSIHQALCCKHKGCFLPRLSSSRVMEEKHEIALIGKNQIIG